MVWNDDLRSSLSMIWFKAESNNPLHFPPLSVFLLLPSLLQRRRGLDTTYLENSLSPPQYSSVCFWILVSDHRRVTTLSLHSLRQYPRVGFNSSYNEPLWSRATKSSFCLATLQSLSRILPVCLSVQHYVSTLEYVCNVGWDIVAQECARERRQLLASHSCNW